MNVRDLIPWSRNEERLPVARRDERRDPISTLRSDIDRLFDHAFGSFGLPGLSSTPSWPSIEIRRKDGEFLVTAEVPGVSEDDIELSLDDGMLVIRGERRSEDGEEGSGYSERFYGRFERRMSLPQGIQEDKVHAEFRDGVLRIHLPHDERMSLSGRRIPINQETRH
ncbi:MAG: Hsp20/alpha crystallin family protein [Erythrobacter sp.]|uniref:Hsp20/alpha crystallin family protein n=1 Tax=Erythrobacter sp. TaxID=1042 RepID=UPI001B1DECD1|nr:Hsp20/alpha crystallin family protein [Erythrobacter sp.]MBO6769705.1 Hsp20/alpha crystallin family protein [Erythrobacter sp.]